jgi:hypothetical protein
MYADINYWKALFPLVSKDSTPSFTPRILLKSELLARESGRLDFPVSTRLSRPATAKTSDSPKSMTEEPRGSSGSIRAFLERQEKCRDVSTNKRAIRQKIEYRDCSFKPQLNPNSERLISSKRPPETQSAVVNRLAISEPNQREHRLRQLESSYYSMHPTVPSIDPRSAALAISRRAVEPGSVHERLYSARPRPLKESKELKDAETPTRPKSATCRRYAHVQGKYNLSEPESVLAYMDQIRMIREERLRARHEELEAKEMDGCTFQPNCDKRILRRSISNQSSNKKLPITVSTPRSPIAVSGLEQFLEAKRRARLILMKVMFR